MHEDRLVRRIQTEFPELAVLSSRLIDKGDDHAVVAINGRLIFRFPRGSAYRKAFADELKVTAALRGKSPIPIPDYTFVARDAAFGGYRRLPGREMTVARFDRLSNLQQRRIVETLARFLSELHRLDRGTLPRYRAREPWSGTDLEAQRNQYFTRRRAVIAPHLGTAMIAKIDAFYDSYAGACRNVPTPAVIHGDLTDDHILLDQRRGRLSGVIDFADAAIGDPAQDFSFLWSYGDWVPKHAYDRYDARNDGMFLERSRFHYLRYAVHRVFYCLRHSKPAAAALTVRRLRQLLKATA